MAKRQLRFDPRTILAALEANYVEYVVIGGLARVLRGTDEMTRGVDICPSFAGGNFEHLGRAVSDLGASGDDEPVSERRLSSEPLVSFATKAGPLNIIAVPAGAPNGFVDLRRGATREDLGQSLRPLVASTADLARMAAALGRDQDLARLPDLRRIMELEVDRGRRLDPDLGRPAARATRAPRAQRTSR